MEQSAKEQDDFDPRNYQITLMQIALQTNTIIYLPTGSGKTFIAVMVLRQLSGSLENSFSQGGKLSIMLVNTVALVDQQAKYLRRFTHLKIGAYSGEMNVDFWHKDTWEVEFEKHQVLVMTAQIFLDLLSTSVLRLSNVNLLIFDECHRGVNDHAMRQIMMNFGEMSTEEQPRVVGLTATLLNRNCTPGQVASEVMELETTFHSKVATVDELKHVIGYSTNPTELIRLFKKHPLCELEVHAIQCFENLIGLLKKLKIVDTPVVPPKSTLVLLENPTGLKLLINLIRDTVSHIQAFGIFGGHIAVVAHIIQLERIKKNCQDSKLASILDAIITTFIFVKKLFADQMKGYSDKDKIQRFSSDQVQVLIDILVEYKRSSKEPLCGIIFVQKRFTAKVLYNVLLQLKNTDKQFEHIRPNFVVGYNTNPYNDTREGLYNVKMNKKVLNEFCSEEINLLVASNVLEEGIDIPICTLVVKFDKPLDYRAYIQSKGRARHKNSFYYIMVDRADIDSYHNKYLTYQKVEDTLNYFLIGQNDERDGPSEEQIQELYDEPELPHYYVNGPGSAKVTMISAISLLCRYCATLPSDKYTSYSPNWFLESITIPSSVKNLQGKLHKVVIELPLICPIKEPIEGQYMNTKKHAKRAAALKACEMLHKAKELDNSLIPKKRNVVDENVSHFFNHWPDNREKTAGNIKKRRIHSRQIPLVMQKKIQPDEELYLHVIELKPLFSVMTEGQQIMHDSYTSQLCYGIISSKPLPQLCTFSVFVSLGEIEVDIQINRRAIFLTDDQILHLRAFEHLVFKDVLRLLKDYLIFDNDEKGEGFLIVPIEKGSGGCEIDFDVVHKHKQLVDQKTEPNDQEKLKLVVSEENYLRKIVTPWYRPDDTQYLVINVCTDLNALSKFPSEEFDCYSSYFSEKYQTTVLNQNHPLLLVKALSSLKNCLRPRLKGLKGNKEKSYETMEEHLIPELCVKQDFPSSLWIQAALLPSIIYRVTSLLQAEELRSTIAKETSLGIVALPKNENWLPLALDAHVINHSSEKETKTKSKRASKEELNSIITTVPQNIMQQFMKDFASKKLESEFPWNDDDEPIDLERCLDVTLMDIQYYENFISQKVTVAQRIKKNEVFNKKDYPAITFDKDFIAKDINLLKVTINNRGPELKDIFTTLTTAKSNDIVNLERLETLGDSFLKLTASLFIILRFPNYDEGKATTLKGRLISNKNLYYIGVGKNIAGYLRLIDFQPNLEWKPPGFITPRELCQKVKDQDISSNSLFNFIFSNEEQISGVLQPQSINNISVYNEQLEKKDDNTYDSMLSFMDLQLVPDKSVADSVEALLGAYFQECGFTSGLRLLEWLEVIPGSEQIVNLLQGQAPNPILAKNINNSNIDFHIPLWQQIEKSLGYHFKNRGYLLQALTHSSYTPNRITHCYQTLEFLGDAVLDFLITCHIFETCGNLNPGQLTDLRSALVNNITFASLTVRCGFHKFLLFCNTTLLEYINTFVEFQESKNFVVDDEVLTLLEENDLYLSEHVDVPKVLGDLFEALAGAVFLDSGMSLETVWNVFYRIMWKEIELFSHNVPKNAVRLLFETPGAHPEFHKPVEIDSGRTLVRLDFMKHGIKMTSCGVGINKTFAKRAAAKGALRFLRK